MLQKGEGRFSGTINTGPAGEMQLFAQKRGEENFAALLSYNV